MDITRACARAARSPPTRPLTFRSHQMHKLSCPHPLNLDSTSSSSFTHPFSDSQSRASVGPGTEGRAIRMATLPQNYSHTAHDARYHQPPTAVAEKCCEARARPHHSKQSCDELEERGEKNALMRPGAARKHRATRAGQVTFFVFAMSFTPDAVIKAACKPSSHLCWGGQPAQPQVGASVICLLRCVMCEKKSMCDVATR
jgi:hypothetical protein